MNLITFAKTRFPNKVICTGSGVWDLDISFGGTLVNLLQAEYYFYSHAGSWGLEVRSVRHVALSILAPLLEEYLFLFSSILQGAIQGLSSPRRLASSVISFFVSH